MDFKSDNDVFTNNDLNDLSTRKQNAYSFFIDQNFRDGINVYKKIIEDYPYDLESYVILGDLYLAIDDVQSAKDTYRSALQIDPENSIIKRRLKLATIDNNQKNTGELPTDSESVSEMLMGLTGRNSPILDEEIQSAAEMLEKIVHSQNPAALIEKNLDQIDNLLPALIELNIRQARNDRRLDIVEMLISLQDSIFEQKNNSIDHEIIKLNNDHISSKNEEKKLIENVIILAPDPDNLSDRTKSFLDCLNFYNFPYVISDNLNRELLVDPDFVFATNPHIKPDLLEQIAQFSSHQIPILLDLEEDFESYPLTHPDYQSRGLCSIEKSKAFTTSLILADQITMPGYSMANLLLKKGYNVEVVPFGWSNKNELWTKPTPQRNTLNLGIIGLPGQYEDVQKIRRIITRTLREFPQTNLIVCGDPVTYKMFDSIPESRKLFLPRVSNDELPYILNQIDILLIPYSNSPFHITESDRLLMESGVKGIPWIASPIPDFVKWKAGGAIADEPEEWHSYLRQFILDKELRTTLGNAGKNHSMKREFSNLNSYWLSIINKVVTSH